MKARSKLNILLYLVVILLIIGGTTYAYFALYVRGNKTEDTIVTTITDAGKIIVTYDDSEGNIEANSIKLEENTKGSSVKFFLKLNVQNTSNVDEKITINWNNLTNAFCQYRDDNYECTNNSADTYVGNEITYALYSCDATTYGEATATSIEESCTKISDTTDKALPLTNSIENLHPDDYLTVSGTTTNYYAVVISLKNLSTNQNYQLSKSFNADVKVDIYYDCSDTYNEVLAQYTSNNLGYKILTDENSKHNCLGITANKVAVNEVTNSSTQVFEKGLYWAKESDGKSVFYRGGVNNNYVQFADILWRIIRINEDGSIRLITEETVITSSATFNTSYDNEKYVGWTYLDDSGNEVSSNAKTQVESWYETNITNKELDSYVQLAKYCNDTSTGSTSESDIYYGAYTRLRTNKTPTFDCLETDKTYGREYELKVGLITADEVAYAGGLYYESDGSASNSSYYLYNNTRFWTMSPHNWYSSQAHEFGVSSTGDLYSSRVNVATPGLRPVINLNVNTDVISGDGTINNPYKIT